MAQRGKSSSASPSHAITPRASNSTLSQQSQRERASSTSNLPSLPVLPTRLAIDSITMSARALYSYEPAPENVDDLELKAGVVITNIDTRSDPADQGWWSGVNPRGQSGLFPSNYVEVTQRPPSRMEYQQRRPLLQEPLQGSA